MFGHLQSIGSFVEAPVVSFTSAENAVTTSGGIVTVTGVGFQTTNLTPSSVTSNQACSTAAWSSISSVACYVDTGTSGGFGKEILMTVSASVATRTSTFSFDGRKPSD